MKGLVASIVCGLCLTLAGCSATSTTSLAASPGAVGECGADCTSACCDKEAVCPYSGESADETSYGAVGTPDCSSAPCSGAKSDTSFGAVGTSDCSSAPCGGAKSDTSFGAVGTPDCSSAPCGGK